jgi:heat shock protein 5
MVQEAEQYADEDKAAKERIDARNSLENYSFSLKNQVNDEEGLGGKIDEEDKETVSSTYSAPNFIGANSFQLLDAIKEATEWLEENASSANAEDFEEQKEKLSNVAYPITSKLYSGPEGDDEPSGHDEL